MLITLWLCYDKCFLDKVSSPFSCCSYSSTWCVVPKPCVVNSIVYQLRHRHDHTRRSLVKTHRALRNSLSCTGTGSSEQHFSTYPRQPLPNRLTYGRNPTHMKLFGVFYREYNPNPWYHWLNRTEDSYLNIDTDFHHISDWSAGVLSQFSNLLIV